MPDPAAPTTEAAPRHVLVTQCLQNDLFLNPDCRLFLQDETVRGLLVARKDGGQYRAEGSPRRISEKALEVLEREGRATSGPLPGRRGIIGSPEKVRAGIEELARDYGAEEVIVVTITHDHQARRRSYELLAEAMGLEPRLTRAAAGAL